MHAFNKKKPELISMMKLFLKGGLLLITLLALLLFSACENTAETPEETTAPEENTETEAPDESGEIGIFWNVDVATYAGQSQSGLSSRQPDKDDGYYHILFATNGRQVSRRCADKKLVNLIDSSNLVGLTFDEKGIISAVYPIPKFTGGYEYFGLYVSDIREDGTIKLNSSPLLNGLIEYQDKFEHATFYDVSGSTTYVGAEMQKKDLCVKDRLIAVKNLEGEISHVFVVEHFARPIVYYNYDRHYDDSIKATTRKATPEGIYEIPLVANGEIVTVRVKSYADASAIDSRSFSGLEFDAQGFVNRVKTAPNTTNGKSFASWWTLVESNKETMTVTAYKPSTDETASCQMAEDCRFFNVSGIGDPLGTEVENALPGDQVHCCTDGNGQVIYVFIIGGRTVDSPMYFNMKRYYDSTAKSTTRKPNAAGEYVFELAVNGSVKNFKTKSRDIATEIDAIAPKCFGLEITNGYITKVYTQKQVTGAGSIASWYTVTKIIDAHTFEATKISATASDAGTVKTVKMTEDCKVVNVGGVYAKQAGEYSTVRVGDIIHGCMNSFTKTSYVFIVTRFIDADIYFNKTRYYNSTTGKTTRTKQVDGYYHYLMAVNGKEVELRTDNQAFADKIDSSAAKLWALTVKGDIITGVYSTTQVSAVRGGVAGSWYKVSAVNKNSLSLYKQSDPSVKLTLPLASNVKIYNVASEYATFGEVTKVQVGDNVHSLVDFEKKAVYVYVVIREAAKRTAVCPVCGKSVNWASMTGSFATSDDTVLHYYLPGNRTVSAQISAPEKKEIHFDLNGYTLTGAKSARTLTVFGANSTVRIFDASAKKTGTIKSSNGKAPATAGGAESGAALWLRYSNSKLYIQDVTLDFSAVNQPETKGALLAPAGSTLELKNVKILAGHTLDGAAIWTAGNTLLQDVTITGGISEQYGSVYYAGGTLTLAGKVSVKDGVNAAGKAANLYIESGLKLAFDESYSPVNASIGLTLPNLDTFSPENCASYLSAFVSDRADGTIILTEGNALKMTYPLSGDAHGHAAATHAEILAGLGEPYLYTAWESDTELPATSGWYYLTKDVHLTVQHAMAVGTDLHLCLNGHTVTAGSGARVISLAKTGCHLTLTDCSQNETGAFIGNDFGDQGGMSFIGASSTFDMYGGTLKNASTTRNGGLLYVDRNGTLNIYGGTLQGGKAESGLGGIIYVRDSAKALIQNATIKNGQASNGGNIYSIGTLNLRNVVINGGSATTAGSVSISGGSVSVKGATITGEVLVGQCAGFTLSGTVKIGSAGGKGLSLLNAQYAQNLSLADGGLSAGSAIYVTAEQEGVILPGGKNAASFFAAVSSTYETYVEGNDLCYHEKPIVHGSHCICGLSVGSAGQTNSAIATAAGHTCASITWNEWTATDSLPTYQNCTVGTTNYWYLSSNVTLSERWKPGTGTTKESPSMAGTKIVICLNGRTVSTTDITLCSGYDGTAKYNATGIDITITDCIGTGKMKASSVKGRGLNGGLVSFSGANCSFTLYKGTLSGNGGTIKGTSSSPSGGGLLFLAGTNSVVNVYGGSIVDGKAESVLNAFAGGNIYCKGTVNVYGGSISGGYISVAAGKDRALYGGNIYAENLYVYGGSITGGTIVNNGIGPAAGSNVYVTGTFQNLGGIVDEDTLNAS